jgi:hypothetical protein
MRQRVEIGSEREIKELDSEAQYEELLESHNELVKLFNFVIKALSLKRNFNCFITEVEFQATGDASGRDSQSIQHFLGVTPKYRIILRQTGNGVLVDTPSEWNSSSITMTNKGSEVVNATIMIVRE